MESRQVMSLTSRVITLIILLVAFNGITSEAVPPGSIIMKIVNNAGAPIELFWINIFETDRPLVKQTTKPIRNNTDNVINSYDTHEFVVKFLQPIDGVDAQASFVKGPKEETVTISYTPDGGMRAVQMTKFDELLVKVKAQTSTCAGLSGDVFDRCFTTGIAEDVNTLEEKKSQVTKYRDLMASRLRNYTCSDEKVVTSKPLYSSDISVHNQKYKIDVMLNTPTAKIWVIENFISDKECEILEQHGRPRLTRATVAGDDGKSVVSENRKAQQASYNKHQINEDDPLIALNDRVLAITNSHAGHKLKGDGQEDFTIIQYNKDDQYTPHCDGSCDGSDHNAGGRVATAVMYCRVATKGGGTTFTKADVFVKPTKGMATFFSYKGTDGKMDDGYTEHSGCPVLEGEKWITTLWMREGVSADDAWTNFDPSGVRLSSYDDQEAAKGEVEEEVEALLTSEIKSEKEDEVQDVILDEIETVLLEEIVDDTTGNIESTVIGSIESQPVDVHNNFLGGIMKGISSWSSELSKKLISKNDL